MLENLDKLRKSPQRAKDHVVAVITIVVMAVITVVWFLFSISSFLKNGIPKSTIPAPPQSQSSGAATTGRFQGPFSN